MKLIIRWSTEEYKNSKEIELPVSKDELKEYFAEQAEQCFEIVKRINK